MADELPQELLIFVNQLNPTASYNYEVTGTFTSRFYPLLYSEQGRRALDNGEVDPFPFVPNPNMYPYLSPFTVSAMNSYRVEYDFEQARRQYFPLVPSRLSAIFAFGDEQTCVEVNRKYGWPLESVRRFKLEDPEGKARVVRVNMEVISLMRSAYPLASWDVTSLNNIWKHYWSGNGDLSVELPDLRGGQEWRVMNSGVIWEWLIEGQVKGEDNSPVFRQ